MKKKNLYQFFSFHFHSFLVLTCCLRSSENSEAQRCSVRKGVLRNFAKFTGKYLCQSLLSLQNTSSGCFWKLALWNILTKSNAVYNEIELIIINCRMSCSSMQEKEGGIKKNKWKYGTIQIWKYDTKYIKKLLEPWRNTTTYL